jgi:carboxymethylenebutenolidase
MSHTSHTGLEQITQSWQDHMTQEFGLKDAMGAVETMTADATIELAPLGVRYEGRDAILRFYRDDFIPCVDSMSMQPRSRTVSETQLVEELRITLKFDRPMPWFLPGIAPTNTTVEFDLVVIVGFQDKRVSFERFHWDRLGVMQQLGRS